MPTCGAAVASADTICLTDEHVRRFADASGDRNPLHVDESFARRTPYGRCVAHGALVTLAALRSVDPDALLHISALEVQFKQPVFPGDTYVLSSAKTDENRTRVEVTRAERLATAITITVDPAQPPLPPPPYSGLQARRVPARRHTVEELAGTNVSISDRYACRLDQLSVLATELGAGRVPEGLLTWLAAASYTVGMLVPGRDALFAGARIQRCTVDGSGTLAASVTTADDRTGLVVVEVVLAEEGASAQMTLQAFLRPPIPRPDRSSIARYLPPSAALTDRQILVVGGSRGLGAALCGGFATQGATAWAAFARSTDQAEQLRREFGASRIRLLQFDAADATEARRAFNTLRAEVPTLDGAVFCAAPPPYETALRPDASEEILRFVQASVAMTLVPLAEAAQLLSPEGWLVLMSSSVLEEIPETGPHYVIAKAALEGAAAYCARHAGARALIVRAPKMWTDSTNTPLGRIGAAAPEQIAAAIVRWAMEAKPAREASLLTTTELLQRSPGRG